MKLTRLYLKNIKAYSEREFLFPDGIIFIRGANGAGKSTILEAVGCALFNVKRGDINYQEMISYGQASGVIELEFDISGVAYASRVVIKKRGKDSWTLFENGVEQLLATDAERERYLCSVMGIEGVSPQRFFTDILCGFQGSFRTPFDDAYGRVKEYFDRIFGVTRYAEKYTALRDVESALARRCLEAEHRAELLTLKTATLEDDLRAAAGITAALEGDRLQLAAADGELADLLSRKRALEEARREREELVRRIASCDERLAGLSAARAATAEGAKKRLADAAAQTSRITAEDFADVAGRVKNARIASIERFVTNELLPAQRAYEEAERSAARAEAVCRGECPVLGGRCHRAAEAGTADAKKARDAAKDALASLLSRISTYDLGAEAGMLSRLPGLDPAPAADAWAVFRRSGDASDYQSAVAAYRTLLAAAAAQCAKLSALFADMEKCEGIIAAAASPSVEERSAVQLRTELSAKLSALPGEAQSGALSKEAEELDALLRSASERAASARSDVNHGEARLSELTERIEKAQKDVASRDAARTEAAELSRAAQVVRDMREVYKKCGPKVAAVLSRALSATADNIYRNIVKNGSSLRFTDDYRLELSDIYRGGERERSYSQLSGGERMSAALSVRLALIRSYSPLSLAFFDEPTDSLDVHRRESLADMLRAELSSFEQVFIISHDAAFDAVTDSVISLD